MRWPLKYQILGPVSIVMLASLAAVSGWSAYAAARRARHNLDQQLLSVTETLRRSSFPLTSRVLEQMKGLSGAEFVVRDAVGRVTSSNANLAASFRPADIEPLAVTPTFPLRQRVAVNGQTYLHAAVPLGPAELPVLHVLYSAAGYREAWVSALYPPLVAGGLAWIAVSLVVAWIAGRFGERLRRLIVQVRQIADGDFRPMRLPARNDEVRDVGEAVNRMATMLSEYHDNVRRSERLRTLEQIGAGMAHQLRNNATGCRLALDIHAQQCGQAQGGESLDMARGQLKVMERYLARFLEVGRGQLARGRAPTDARELCGNVVALVQPQARHLGVELTWTCPAAAVDVLVDREELEQALSNVVINALQAAAGNPAQKPRRVALTLSSAGGLVRLEVRDTGPGPAASIGPSLFEPFVTDKPDGVGLGLAVARDIVAAHDGRLEWRRIDEWTIFVIELPLHQPESEHGDAAGR